MSVPDEVRRDAERAGELVRKKLMAIMDLQAEIDTLSRGDNPRRSGRRNGNMLPWKPCNASWQ
ncbi:MAG: hypothetical protein ACLQGP_37500 [Isosphaeraceae bacterium]